MKDNEKKKKKNAKRAAVVISVVLFPEIVGVVEEFIKFRQMANDRVVHRVNMRYKRFSRKQISLENRMLYR